MPVLLIIALIVVTMLYGLSWHHKRARQVRSERHDAQKQPSEGK